MTVQIGFVGVRMQKHSMTREMRVLGQITTNLVLLSYTLQGGFQLLQEGTLSPYELLARTRRREILGGLKRVARLMDIILNIT